ncbi:MAG: aminodeoxychorismate/anthranilate synthase component II [Bacteroidales bacterium]|nr:aminodeoxychorismate/anthranilate synthase component II [Bacteroidales bacterium]
MLIIDNYDSFTYNLFHYLEQIDNKIVVKRPHEIEVSEIEKFSKIVLSPGPGLPGDIELLQTVIRNYHKTKSILGICLGHQALGLFFGAKLYNLPQVHHGVQKRTKVCYQHQIFENVPEFFETGRYHSWAIDRKLFPDCLEIIAEDTDDKIIMGITHNKYNIVGLQFHPESIMTPDGLTILKNWVNL